MRSRLFPVAALALLSWSAACGGDDEGEPPGGTGAAGEASENGGASAGGRPGAGGTFTAPADATPVAEAPERLGDVCEVILSCGCPGAEGVTQEDCEAFFQSPTDGAIAEGEAAGLTYDGTCVNRVAAAFEFARCASESEWQGNPDILKAAVALTNCRLFTGEGTAGDPCESLTQSNGDSCDRNHQCVRGACQPLEFQGAEGTACERFEDCEPGLLCFDETLQGGAKTCQRLPLPSEPCLLDALCATNAFCDRTGETPTCAALPGPGEACSDVMDLQERTCAIGAYCDGDDCAALPEAGVGCVDGACAPGNVCQSGQCVVEEPSICSGGPFPLFNPE